MAPPRTAARRQRNAQTSTMACLQGVSGALVICMAVTVFLYAFLLPTNSKMSTNQDASEKGHRGDEAKVIVVGGGLAGLSAAIEAYRHGAQVTIIDKEKNLGGNSAKATSGINAVNTDHQSELSIADSIEKFISDTLQSGDGLSSEHLVKVLAKKSASAISFLESFDLLLSDIVQLGGHSVKRTHRFPPTKDGRAVPVGFTLVSALKKYVNSVVTTRAEREDEFRDIIIINSARFESLLYDDDAVAGIRFQWYTDLDSLNIKSLEGAVILASGGFANDHANDSLLERYVPKLAHLPTTNGAWATGDILKYAQNSKISLVDMNKVQVHPTGFVEPSKPLLLTKFLAPEALRGCGAILLDNNGKRFANELGRRDYLTKKIFESCATFKVVEDNPVVATMVLTQKIIDRFGAPLAGFYQFKKLINKVGPLSKLGEYLGVSQETIDSTLERYNKSAVQGKDEYGKTAFPATFSVLDEYYVAFVTPSLHYCMGGLRIDADACVLGHAPSDAKRGQDASSPRRRIAGLYAAGEVTGGVHGNNRLGGNSLLECVVFGRRAGINSAHYRRG